MIHAVGLAGPHASLEAALQYSGYVQIDPINVCGRMHDLILRNRVRGYREGDLARHLYSGDGKAFETFLPIQGVLAAFPSEDWRFLNVRMRARAGSPKGYNGRMTKGEAKLAETIVAEIRDRGTLGSDAFAKGPRRRTDWGTHGSLGRKVVEKLFSHGRLLIARREGLKRIYDLPERIIPAEHLAAPAPSPEEFNQWSVRKILKQRRLVTLRRQDAAAGGDILQPVRVEGCPPMFCLREDVDQLANGGDSRAKAIGEPLLLAPLDPLIYDRKITAGLWGYDYTWEVYTPPAKRKRGYYALPILSDGKLVGHVDPKADRGAGKLRVMAKSCPRGVKVAGAVAELAAFLGLK